METSLLRVSLPADLPIKITSHSIPWTQSGRNVFGTPSALLQTWLLHESLLFPGLGFDPIASPCFDSVSTLVFLAHGAFSRRAGLPPLLPRLTGPCSPGTAGDATRSHVCFA